MNVCCLLRELVCAQVAGFRNPVDTPREDANPNAIPWTVFAPGAAKNYLGCLKSSSIEVQT